LVFEIVDTDVIHRITKNRHCICPSFWRPHCSSLGPELFQLIATNSMIFAVIS